MLSICIPHFNFQNPALFLKLKEQASALEIAYEILIFDDASKEENLLYLKGFEAPPYRIKYLKENISRSAMRNLLAHEAKYPHLIFLDGDSTIEKKDFLKTYLRYLSHDLVSGGRYYSDEKADKYHLLHWLYGKKVESKSTHQFHSCNFMIKKSVLNTIQFDEHLKGYGYEDVLFGLQAQKNGIQTHWIDNPVLHQQLKLNDEFLSDVQRSLINLKILEREKEYQDLLPQIRIYQKYQQLKNWGLVRLLPLNSRKLNSILAKELKIKPEKNLWLLNFYKLSFFHQLK